MADGAYGAFAIDMDHDADLDVLSAARNMGEISVHTQIWAGSGQVELGGSAVINASQLLTTDPDDGPDGLTYTLTDAPDYGELRLSGVVLAASGTFTQGDVNDGRLTYAHGGTITLPDLFSFRVADGGEDRALPVTGNFVLYVAPPPTPTPTPSN